MGKHSIADSILLTILLPGCNKIGPQLDHSFNGAAMVIKKWIATHNMAVEFWGEIAGWKITLNYFLKFNQSIQICKNEGKL